MQFDVKELINMARGQKKSLSLSSREPVTAKSSTVPETESGPNRWERPYSKREIYQSVAETAFTVPNHETDLTIVASQLDTFDPENPATWKKMD